MRHKKLQDLILIKNTLTFRKIIVFTFDKEDFYEFS